MASFLASWLDSVCIMRSKTVFTARYGILCYNHGKDAGQAIRAEVTGRFFSLGFFLTMYIGRLIQQIHFFELKERGGGKSYGKREREYPIAGR